MKTICLLSLPLLLFPTGLAADGTSTNKTPTAAAEATNAKLPPEVAAFAAAKETQAKELAKKLDVDVSPDIWAFFAAVKEGDAAKAAGLGKELTIAPNAVWETVVEVRVAVEGFTVGEPKYAAAFGRDVIASIPAGSIYFAGPDPGCGLVAALSKSHAQGDPFFTVSQNALGSKFYLAYLQAMYGARIHVPTEEDIERCSKEYEADALRRSKEHKLKPGEQVVNGEVQITMIAHVTIIGQLTKLVFDKNPDRQFFVEESFPRDWMYPHLTPHGLILKIERRPLEAIPPAVVEQDREYWNKQVRPMLGDWLKPETPVKIVGDFAERVFGQKNLAGFTGDPKYMRNHYCCKMYSKLRSSIAGVYLWRINQAKKPEEKERMRQAADFAFRQAFALCPNSPEAVFRYVNFLMQEKRVDDALLIAQTAAKLEPEAEGSAPILKSLVEQLQRMAKKQSKDR